MLRASQGHGHESHIIFASHFRTLGRSLLGEGQPGNGTKGKGTARGTAGSEGGEAHWDGHCAGIQCGTRNGNAFTLAATGCIITLILYPTP